MEDETDSLEQLNEEIADLVDNDVITPADGGFISGFIAAGESIAEKNKLFEDNNGHLLTPDEVDELSHWEVEEREIRVAQNIGVL